MITQSFLSNAIFFTYALVLVNFYGVSANSVLWCGLAFSVGNLLGPLLLGPLFDTVGRKPVIGGTYLLSGLLLVISAYLFGDGASRTGMVWGYAIGLIMALGGVVELLIGIKAEGLSLESVTKPLTSVDAASPSPEGAGA